MRCNSFCHPTGPRFYVATLGTLQVYLAWDFLLTFEIVSIPYSMCQSNPSNAARAGKKCCDNHVPLAAFHRINIKKGLRPLP